MALFSSRCAQRFVFCLLCLWVCCGRAGADDVQAVNLDSIHHYVFFDMDRQRIHEPAFWNTKAFAGAQLKYTWRELEPAQSVYDFRAIRKDLAFLTSKHRKLFIQLQDTTFSPALVYVPKYLLRDARFHGGADRQYNITGEDEAHAQAQGWVARRWDRAVQKRFHKLLFALGKEFDGRIEGINLPETAIDVGESGRLFPTGFTPALYRDAVLTNMAALKRAFPRSVTMLYANFMPGEWLPDNDKGYLRSVYRRARALKVGVGGPDLLPYNKGQRQHSYPLIRACHGIVPTGIAVQEGDYATKNPDTAKATEISDLVGFARDHLKVNYLFWCTQEPFYTQKLIPFLNGAR